MIDITEDFLEGALKLSECPPTRVSPEYLGAAINGYDVPKDYASTVLGIKSDYVPDYLFEQGLTMELAKAMSRSTHLIEANDVCDRVGIEYLARVYIQACAATSNEFGRYLCADITQSPSGVAELARRYSASKL